jgi:hypothetical protein
MSLWFIGAASLIAVGSMRIIFFSIVRLLVPYGVLSSVVLGGLQEDGGGDKRLFSSIFFAFGQLCLA